MLLRAGLPGSAKAAAICPHPGRAGENQISLSLLSLSLTETKGKRKRKGQLSPVEDIC